MALSISYRPGQCNPVNDTRGDLYTAQLLQPLRRTRGSSLPTSERKQTDAKFYTSATPPVRPPAARRKLIKRPNDRRNEPSTNRKRLSQVSVGRGVRQGRSASSSANCRSLIASSDVDIQQPFIHERVLAAERPQSRVTYQRGSLRCPATRRIQQQAARRVLTYDTTTTQKSLLLFSLP